MRRGEVWWVEYDVLRPVVVLEGDEESGFEVIQVVPAAGVDLGGLGLEVPVGPIEGFPHEGVVRLAFPDPDRRFCTWLTSLPALALVSRACVLPPEKADEVEAAVRRCGGLRRDQRHLPMANVATQK